MFRLGIVKVYDLLVCILLVDVPVVCMCGEGCDVPVVRDVPVVCVVRVSV